MNYEDIPTHIRHLVGRDTYMMSPPEIRLILINNANEVAKLDYDQIKKDVLQFRSIALEVDMFSYCAIGSLLLLCCLNDHSIKAELVKGYLVAEDTFWKLHIWTKININGMIYQIDVVHNLLKEIGGKLEYTLTLNDKWVSLIDTEQEKKDYDQVMEMYSLYQEHGVNHALAYIGNIMQHKQQWRLIINRLSTLPTFSTIKKHTEILSL